MDYYEMNKVFAITLMGIAVGNAQPMITGIFNSATFTTDIAFSSIAMIKGSGFASAPTSAPSLPFPSKLASVEVMFCNAKDDFGRVVAWSNCQAGLLLYADQAQINVAIPDLPGNPDNYLNPLTASVRVRVNGVDDQNWTTRNPVTFTMLPAAPVIYRLGYDCAYPAPCAGITGQPDTAHMVQLGALTDGLTGILVSSSNPLRPKRVYSLYLTGAGVTSFSPVLEANGNYLQLSPSAYYFYGDDPTHLIHVLPQFIGLVPGYAGFDQINLSLPDDFLRTYTDGENLPLCSTITADIQKEIHIVSTGWSGDRFYKDTITVPAWIKPGELTCQFGNF